MEKILKCGCFSKRMYCFVAATVLFTFSANSQTTVNCATGTTFTDSGGSGGNYGNNETSIITYETADDSPIQVDFTSFNLGGGVCENDSLIIYDGNSVSAPMIGFYCGSNSPGTVTGSGKFLTFRFVSNSSVVSSGWTADLSCYECLDDATCEDSYVTLSFTGAIVNSGANSGADNVGKSWRFNNVYAGTYAIAEIVAEENTQTNAIQDIDEGTPFAGAWSPELNFVKVPGEDSYLDWEVTFYDNTTNAVKPLPQASRVTSYDVDGPGNPNFNEIHGHTNPDGYILGSVSELTISEEPPRTIVIGTPGEYTGISDNDFSKVTFYYSDSLAVFKIRLGLRSFGDSGNQTGRQFALGFVACPDFDDPIVTPIINQISGASELCLSDTSSQIYSVSNNFSNIIWSVSGGVIVSGQGSQNVTVTWNGIGNHKISVITTDGTSCEVETSKSVTIVDGPDLTVAGDVVCVGETINLTASGGANMYSWTGPGFGSANTNQNPTISNAQLSDAGEYILTATDVMGCTAKDTVIVIVNVTPDGSVSGTTIGVCQGTTSANLNLTGVTGSPSTYNITYSGAAISAGFINVSGGAYSNPISLVIPPSASQAIYNATLVLNNSSCSSDAIPFTVTVVDVEGGNIGGDEVICIDGDPAILGD